MPALAQTASAAVEQAEARPGRLELQVVDPTQVAGWDHLVEPLPGATPFHTAAWARVLSRTYGHRPQYHVWGSDRRQKSEVRDQKSEVRSQGPETSRQRSGVGGRKSANAGLQPGVLNSDPRPLPSALCPLTSVVPLMELSSPLTGRRGVSLPFTDYCFPLSPARDLRHPTSPSPIFDLRSSTSPLWSALLAHGRARGWRYLEMRGGDAPRAAGSAGVLAGSSNGAPVVTPFQVKNSSNLELPPHAGPSLSFYGHEIDLMGTEAELFKRCDSSVRRAVHKAQKSGLKIELSHALDAVHDFYALHERTRRHHGLPPQPFRLFLAIHDEIISRGAGFIAMARLGTKPVAAALILHFAHHAIYKYAASDGASLDLRGNDLVLWETIRWLAANRFQSLHLGRTSMSNDGLRRFKSGWGTRESILHYYRYDFRADAFVTAAERLTGWHNRVFRKMPLAVNRLAGAVLYPHLD
jgi:hypothetical protein